MADPQRMFAFRRSLAIDPYLLPINSTSAAVPVAINKAGLQTAGATSFKMHNPCPFWVWFRGWSGAQTPIPTIVEKGHYLAPGATDLNTSQLPDWIAAMPQAEPGFPLPADLATGSYRLVMIYGSGM